MYNDLPVWVYCIIALGLTHVTIAAVTIYLHRHQTHRALELSPIISHFFRFWLWLTTGMGTKEWVSVHRKHHARVESENDPHSPHFFGIRKVLFDGVDLYQKESREKATLEQFGHETPDDWIERNIYGRFTYTGVVLMLLINALLFGFVGVSIWALQMAWIPFFAAGVINGVGHWWGYRNFEPSDASTNIIPFGILIGGEELHNNHHAYASSARFSSKWYEIDLGWYYIKVLSFLGLATVKKVAPRPIINHSKQYMDVDSVKAIVSGRLHVMAHYTRDVVKKVYKDEKVRANVTTRKLLKKSKRLLTKHELLLDSNAKIRLKEALNQSDALRVVYDFRQRLQALWQQKTASNETLRIALQEWCAQAEQTGIEALEEFAQTLRRYSLQSV